MKYIDYEKLKQEIIGDSVPAPYSSSGHSTGDAVDKYVYDKLKKMYPINILRQYDYLNELYTKNPVVAIRSTANRAEYLKKNPKDIVVEKKEDLLEKRYDLIGSKSLSFLLKRGEDVTKAWTPKKLFKEKQDDTADMIYKSTNFIEIIDIKSRNLSKSSRPPNIISAEKVAKLCMTCHSPP